MTGAAWTLSCRCLKTVAWWFPFAFKHQDPPNHAPIAGLEEVEERENAKYFVVRTNALAGLPVRDGFERYGGDAYFDEASAKQTGRGVG